MENDQNKRASWPLSNNRCREVSRSYSPKLTMVKPPIRKAAN
jgi:hypothetical protein